MNDNVFKTKLTVLFLLGGLAESILLPTIHIAVSGAGFPPETADIGVYIALLIVTGSLLIYASLGARNIEKLLDAQTEFWAGQILFVLLLFSASTITVLPGFEGKLWFGYGQKIAIISIFLIPILIALYNQSSVKVDILLSVATYGVALLVYLPSILQPPWGVVDSYHSPFVVNELLAPQSGNYPAINFSAKYTSILGYVFNLLFQSRGSADQAIWFLTILAILTVVVSLAPIIRLFPKHKGYLAVIFTVPAIFIVKANEDSYSGSISVLFSSIPVRLIFPSLIALLLSTKLFRARRSAGCILIGALCSIAILNNFETGIVATIAAMCVIGLSSRRQRPIFVMVLFCASLAVFLVLAQIIFQLAYGSGIKLQALVIFVGGFSGGFGALPMPSFGLWVFAFIFLALSIIVSALHMHAAPVDGSGPGETSERTAILVLFWGLFGMGMSPYYINRSVVSGQLQYILFSVFLSSAGLFILIVQLYGRIAARNAVLIIASLPAAISAASLIQHPSFFLAMDRLKPAAPMSASYNAPIVELSETISQIKEAHGNQKIGLLSDYGHILAGPLSVRSYLPVDDQNDFNEVKTPIATQICASLEQDKNVFLVAYRLQPQNLRILENCGYRLDFTKPNQHIFQKY